MLEPLGSSGGFSPGVVVSVSDFETGDAGDRLELSAWLSATPQNYASGSDPLASGHLRLVRAGSDVLLRVDRNGGGDAFETAMRFQDVTVAAFTAFNFDGFAPNGGPPRLPRPGPDEAFDLVDRWSLDGADFLV